MSWCTVAQGCSSGTAWSAKFSGESHSRSFCSFVRGVWRKCAESAPNTRSTFRNGDAILRIELLLFSFRYLQAFFHLICPIMLSIFDLFVVLCLHALPFPWEFQLALVCSQFSSHSLSSSQKTRLAAMETFLSTITDRWQTCDAMLVFCIWTMISYMFFFDECQ